MSEIVTFVTMHLMPPTAAFALWNEYRKRRTVMMAVTMAGSVTAGLGLLLDRPPLGLAGLMLLAPPVLAMWRDFRAEDG
ncbi:hypothetical protein [Streptomyces californicus]|uniref:hypothetical protein n=1 Tax=Streptomyces californicus TaxID=67351 RepID=UPI00297000EC|nr:hypothetical protein [Streptomyces californicus]MDW4912445.1 hypothetical protein [Streptomyces californicus]